MRIVREAILAATALLGHVYHASALADDKVGARNGLGGVEHCMTIHAPRVPWSRLASGIGHITQEVVSWVVNSYRGDAGQKTHMLWRLFEPCA
jgi:hypothetical protein